MSEQLAAQVLEGALLLMVDDTAASNAAYDPKAVQEAQNFLRSYALSQGNPTVGYDQANQPVPLFGVSAPYQRQDPTIFSDNPQALQVPTLGASQMVDWSVGWMRGIVSTLNPANVASGVQSTVQMVTDPAGWLSDQQASIGQVFYQAQHGNFEPAGQVEGTLAGNAAIGAAVNYGMANWGAVGGLVDDGDLLSTGLDYIPSGAVGQSITWQGGLNDLATFDGQGNWIFKGSSGQLSGTPIYWMVVNDSADVDLTSNIRGLGSDSDLNLATPGRTNHILNGDATGGGHLWPGRPGKSPFPQNWSENKIMNTVSDIATDPTIPEVVQANGRIVKTHVVEGVKIRVVLESPERGGGIVTAFPTNTPRNSK